MKKLQMEATCGNLVTAPGGSDPQVPAAVGGSGVTSGSNVAGLLRSSSNDRESAGVSSQALATLPTTRAETVVSQKGTQQLIACNFGESLALAMNLLKSQLSGQHSALSAMLTKAVALQAASNKSKSPHVQAAINEVLGAIEAFRSTNEKVTRLSGIPCAVPRSMLALAPALN